ncbi:GD24472 [Drosophila simulans]|uniref:Inhibitor of growth protein n=1 Tax=Drosophila simulans TaxID=7240 RepID=B4NUN1_DROSI|nr:GD24472 [Drosophila simulans]
MLYLEDYLEMIEHLPQELRDRFTEMRELDLAVQNNMDSLDKKAHMFFKQCKRDELQHESMDTEFHSLRGEYFKVMEDADEKVAIATQIHELVERYLRRLDSELFKFKCELEADNNGITEILERRSLELDGNSTAATALLLSMNQKENRYYGASSANTMVNSSAGHASGAATGSSGIALVSGAAGTGGALSSISTAQLGSSQRHRKLEKRRETICTVPSNEGEWSYDPNEPRYCTCNQVSYGDMVACDNDACPYEWFHYPCVGITQPPKGKWYCPKCTASMRRRGNRKN